MCVSLDVILFTFSFGKSCNNDSHKKYNFLVASLVCLFDCLCVCVCVCVLDIISLHKSSSKILTSLFACVGSVYGVCVCVCVCFGFSFPCTRVVPRSLLD